MFDKIMVVTFEIAKKLKEKGFYYKCVSTYDKDGMLGDNYIQPTSIRAIGFDELLSSHNVENDGCIDAPTISQVLEWLRKNHKLHISTKPYPCEDGLMWMYEVRKFSSVLVCVVTNKTGFQEPEQAELAGIKYVLDNLI